MRAVPAFGLAALAVLAVSRFAAASPADDKSLSAEEKAAIVAVEHAMRRLHDEAVKEAIDAFKKELRAAKSIGERVAAVQRLGEAERDAKIIPEFSRLAGDAESVRIAAMEALAKYRRDKAAAQALLAMIGPNSRSASMLGRTLDALGGTGHESIVPAVSRYVTDKDERVAVAAIGALGETNTPAAIPPLLGAWEDLEKDFAKDGDIKKAAEERLKIVKDPFKAALAKLTGERHDSAADYRTWWLQHRATLRPKEEPPPPLCHHFDPASWPGRILPTGCILREVWKGINGGTIGDLRRDNRMAKPPAQRGWLPRLDAPRDCGDDYGTRLRGYIHPPVDGDYTFWIASDDDSELWLSPDDLPGNKVRIAKRDGATGWCNWNDQPGQKSKPIRLAAGKRYYLEVLHKEGGGGDHVSVAWQPPGGGQDIVPGHVLSPFVAMTEKLDEVVAALGEMPKAGAPPSTPAPVPGAPPAAGDLAAHWPLDEGPGATLVADAAGRAPAGVLRGTPEWTDGVAGKALRFSAPDQAVEMPPSSALNDVEKGSYTLAAWFRPEGVPSGVQPDADYTIVIKTGWHLGLSYTADGRFRAQHWLENDQNKTAVSNATYPPGAFHHVAMTVDKPAGVLRLYVDGRQVGENRWGTETPAKDYKTSPWRIGCADPRHGQYRWAAKGTVDDVRIYARALSEGELMTLHRAGAAGAVPAAPPPARPEKLLRAVNLNGPAVVVDGVPWEAGEAAENCLVGGRPFAKTSGALDPAAEGMKGWMLRSGVTNTGTLPIVVGGVPAGRYRVFLYVWEDDAPVEYGVAIEGKEVVTGRSSGAAGRWEKVGPLAAEAADGAIRIRVTGGAVNVSGLEVWRE